MKKDKETPQTRMATLKKLIRELPEAVAKKKHLSDPERDALNKLNAMDELAIFSGMLIGRMMARGMSKQDVLYAVSAMLKMTPMP